MAVDRIVVLEGAKLLTIDGAAPSVYVYSTLIFVAVKVL